MSEVAVADRAVHRIYEGTIRHRRFLPVTNAFQYRVFFLLLDLAHLPALSGIHPLWSGSGVNLAYFRRRDHTGDPKIPLERTIRKHVEEKTGMRPAGPVRLLTHLRYFGHCFNPASFYYCYDAADRRVEAIVVEIHNTPWGEEHLYVLSASASEDPSAQWQRHRFKKAFHVSPFMDMGLDYDWRFRVTGKKLNVHMINFQGGEKLFDASLSLAQKPLTRRNLTRVLLLYPVLTVKVVALIYWQALKLIVKGAPFFTHPGKTNMSTRPGTGFKKTAKMA